jgi:hypothetical protein
MVRLHLSLFDEPADDKQRTVAFLEVDVQLPDGVTVADYAAKLNARAYVTEAGAPATQVIVSLVPDADA